MGRTRIVRKTSRQYLLSRDHIITVNGQRDERLNCCSELRAWACSLTSLTCVIAARQREPRCKFTRLSYRAPEYIATMWLIVVVVDYIRKGRKTEVE